VNIADLVPPAEQRVDFDLYFLNRIVDCTACYCLTNAAGDIIYVGQARSVMRRLCQHFDSEKRSALTGYGRVSRVWWRPVPLANLNALERGWLEAIRLRDGCLPPLNRTGAPI
jgi:hypothetical protein